MEPSNIAVISALRVYPVKSCHGIDLSEAKITERGLEWDRNWVVVDTESGVFISQRTASAEIMAQIRVSIDKEHLALDAPGTQALCVPLEFDKSRERRQIRVQQDLYEGFDEGDAAAQWLQEFLKMDLRLIRLDPHFVRVADPFYAGRERARSAGQDGFPYLITAEESLAAVNKLREDEGIPAIPMGRFRENIRIRGLQPFAEDELSSLAMPERGISFRPVKECGRCKIIDVDQESGVPFPHGKEAGVLRHLATFRTRENKKGERHAMFGQNAVCVEGVGKSIRVGDTLVAS